MKLDMSKAVRIGSPSDLGTTSAALSNSTHLNMNLAKKLDMSKAVPSDTEPQDNTHTPDEQNSYQKVMGSLQDVGQGIAKGALSTATGLGTLFSKALSYLPGKAGEYFKGGATEGESLLNDPNSPLAAHGTAQEIGKGAEQIGEFLIPGGEVEKLEKLLAGGAKTATIDALTKAGLSPQAAKVASAVASRGVKMGVRAGEGGAILGVQSGGKHAGSGAEFGALISGAEGPIGAAVKKIAAPFKGSFDEGMAKAFEAAGIKPPISAVIKSPFLKGTEATASKTLFGQGITDIATKAKSDIESHLNSLVDSVKPEKNLSDEELGNKVKSGLQDAEDKFKKAQGDIYDQFSKTYGSSDTYGKSTKDALATITESQKNDLLKGTQGDLKAMLNKITGNDNPELKQLQADLTTLKNTPGVKSSDIRDAETKLLSKQAELDKPLTFDQLKATRTSVGEMIQRQPENTAYKRLYSALSTDLDSAVSTIDPENGGRALQDLNKGYATGKNEFTGSLAQSIKQSSPAGLGKTIGTKNSAETYKSLKKWMNPEDFNQVKSSFLKNIFDDSVTRDKFDVEKFKNNLAKFDKNTINEILPPEDQKMLSDFTQGAEAKKVLSDAMKSSEKYSQGSQTAFLRDTITKKERIYAAAGAFLTGHPAVAAGVLADFGGEYAFSKLFTSDFGRKLLTEGFTPENAKLLERMKDITPAVKATIIESLSNNSNQSQ